MANFILEGQVQHPVKWISGQFTQMDPFQLTNFRLPSILATLLGLGLGLWMLRKLFPSTFLIFLFLTLINSYYLVFIGKVATADSWTFCFQTLAILSIIRYMKEPGLGWRLSTYGLLLLAVWVSPQNSRPFSLSCT